MQTVWAERHDFEATGYKEQEGLRLALTPGSSLEDPGRAGAWCYVIERGLVANYVKVDQARPTCVSLGGPGDLIGLGALFGGPESSQTESRAVGVAHLWRMPTSALHAILKRSPEQMDFCLQQFQARLNEVQSVAACNARHVLPARCAHWLLRLHAYLGEALPVTHEFMASVLGVRRAGVTVTLQGLQRRGAIRQQRGSIVIADLDQLRQTACSCAITVARPAWPIPAEPEPAPLPVEAIQLPTLSADGPRAWTVAAVRKQMQDKAAGNRPIARIEAVLQVCRAVMERTEASLTG